MERITPAERAIWAAFASDLYFGPTHLNELLALNETLQSIWEKPEHELKKIPIRSATLQAIVKLRTNVDPIKVLTNLQKQGIKFITRFDADYPALLGEITVPPVVLYIRGKLENKNHTNVAIVGSRRMTTYGKRTAEYISRSLAQSGITIVSGLALGIDSVSHKAALEAEGITWAVLGCGLDQIYPSSHTQLGERILSNGGALISEFPPGTPALRHHFPIRNRIIAGLCSATIIVEATERSGTLSTARAALDANREVFAVPGSIFSPNSVGSHALLKSGAGLLHTPNDILEALGLEMKSSDRPVTQLTSVESVIFATLSHEPMLLDDLITATQLTSSAIVSTLTLMEIKGLVQTAGQGRYVRSHS
ncbi:DNA-protecting protein DprA [Candidatus Berkelbacteria bacterium]|nr:DNA-protecting protein DprA [Candidatus Berkelbacteria bacterium]